MLSPGVRIRMEQLKAGHDKHEINIGDLTFQFNRIKDEKCVKLKRDKISHNKYIHITQFFTRITHQQPTSLHVS